MNLLEFDEVKLGGLFQDLSFSVDKSSVLLGSNGSGKTTILRAASGLIEYEGSINVLGKEVKDRGKILGYSTNLPEVYRIGDRVKDLLKVYSDVYGVKPDLFNRIMHEVGFQNIIEKKVSKLSAGQWLAVRDILAISNSPKVITLDEPTENLDPMKKEKLLGCITSMTGVLMVTHDFHLLERRELSTWDLFILSEGRVYGPTNIGELMESDILCNEKVQGEEIGRVLLERGGKVCYILKAEEQTKEMTIRKLEVMLT